MDVNFIHSLKASLVTRPLPDRYNKFTNFTSQSILKLFSKTRRAVHAVKIPTVYCNER